MSGSLRATDTLYSIINQFKILHIPTASNGATYGPGTDGQILKSNGTSVYWSDTSVKAEKDKNGDVIDTTYVKLRADNTITGTNTFSGQVILTRTNDASLTAGGTPALLIGGNKNQPHIEIDANEILCKNDDTTLHDININIDGGQVLTGGNYVAKGHQTTDSGGNTTWTGGQIYAGVDENTSTITVRARSSSGHIGLYSGGNADGNGDRGIWAYAHGTGAAKSIVKVDTNNNVFYAPGTITGTLNCHLFNIDAQTENNGITTEASSSTSSIKDKNDLTVSRLEARFKPNGNIIASWDVRNYNNSTSPVATKGIRMIMDKTGHFSCAFDEPKEFRTALGICYGVCNTAQATQNKIVNLTDSATTNVNSIFSLTTGMLLAVKFTYAAAGSTMTLNVNGTGAKKLYQYGTALMSSATTTSGWPAGAIVLFVYDESLDYNASTNTSNGGWTRIYWTNTTEPSNIVSRSAVAGLEAETSANGGVGLSRYALSMMTINQKWSNIAHVAGSTASDQTTTAAKEAATADFLLNSPIYYTSTNLYVAPGSSGAMNGYNIININLRYSIGTSGSNVNLTVSKPVYLVGTPNTDGNTFKLYSTQWWTQDPNTFANKTGKIFIYLGIANSTSNVHLVAYHPIFYHDGNSLKIYSPNIYALNNVANGVLYATAANTQPTWGILPIAQGGTGATTAQNAKSNLGLGDLNLSASNTYGGNIQQWGIGGNVASTSTITRAFDQKRTHLIIKDNGLYLYNGTDDKGVWDISMYANNIVMGIYNTPTEANPGQLKAQFRLAYKAADNETVGDTNTPIYLNNTGSAAACSVVNVAHGGTGATSFTANRIIVSNPSSTTGALTTREILTASTVTHLNWGSSNDAIPNKAMLAYWNGRFNANSSNLQYCDRGRFGTIVTHDFYYNSKPTSNVSAGALAFIPI